QSFLYTLDSTPAMDFLLPAVTAAPVPAPPGGGHGGGGTTTTTTAAAETPPPAAPTTGAVAGTQVTRTRSVSGRGVVRGTGRAGTASFQVSASKVVYRSRTDRFGSLSV